MADWQTFDLGDVLQGTEYLDKVQDVADLLISVGNVATSVLELLKVFMISVPNPIEPAVQLLLSEIETVLENLESSEANGLFLIPTSLEELHQYQGGYPKFRTLFMQSLYDMEDPNRPQIGSDGYLGALFLLVTKDNVADFIRQIISLQYLTQIDMEIRYPPPINVEAVPADSDGDPVESMINLFSEDDELTTILLSWEEPKFTQSLFYDIFADNKFYIERSKSREGKLLTRQKTKVTQKDPLRKRTEKEGDAQGVEEPLLNRKGEPVSVWEPLDEDNPFVSLGDGNDDVTANWIAGSYSYVVKDVEKGVENGYYYRIRSVPEEVTLEERTLGGETVHTLILNGQEYTESDPSVPVFGSLPDVDTTFDMPTALLNVYRAAYMLRFDADTYDDQGTLMIGSSSLEEGVPQYLLEQETQIPEGTSSMTLQQIASAMVPGFDPLDGDEDSVRFFAGPLFEEEVESYEMSKWWVASVGSITASDDLENDPFSGARELFAQKFGLSTREQFRIWVDKMAIKKIKKILPIIMQNDSLFEMVKSFYTTAEPVILPLLEEGDFSGVFMTDIDLRTKVHQVIQMVDRHETQGIPPNWQAIRPLEDLIPEASSVLDRLFKMMSAFEQTFADFNASIDSTLEALRGRLDLLNDIIDVLDGIVAFFESLSVLDFSISTLFIPPAVGGVPYLTNEFMAAQNTPDTNPDDFTAGIVLAFGGPGEDDYKGPLNAVKFIFGL
jgi:hypothetical protein